jgi:hypothetical protein
MAKLRVRVVVLPLGVLVLWVHGTQASSQTASARVNPAATAVPPQRGGVRTASSVPMQSFTAEDYTYTVSLPTGWKSAVRPTLDYGLFFGIQAESFAVGMEQVFVNAAILRSQLQGYSAILSREQLTLKSRMLGPPMPPLDVVTRLLPHIAGGPNGAIQNLRVLRSFVGPQELGFQQILVLYAYTFRPQRDRAFASQAHPALLVQPQVPMQAAAYIVTFPYMQGQFSWQFGYRILSAPQNTFR